MTNNGRHVTFRVNVNVTDFKNRVSVVKIVSVVI